MPLATPMTYEPVSRGKGLTLLVKPTPTVWDRCAPLWLSGPLLGVTVLRRSGLLATPGCPEQLVVRSLAPRAKPPGRGMRTRLSSLGCRAL